MKATIIGTLSGVSAAIMVMLLSPRPAAPVVREIPLYSSGSAPALAAQFLPATRPNAIVQRMNKILARVKCDDMPLEKFIAWIGEQAGVNIYVEWHAIMGAAAGPDTLVTLNLQNVSAAHALQLALDQSRVTGDRIRFIPMDGVLKVSMQSRMDHNMSVRVYDVRDLIEQGAKDGDHRRKPVLDRFSSSAAANPGTPEDQAIESLRTILQKSIETNIWPESTDIDYFAGRFIIKSTGQNHESITAMLAALRAKAK